MLSFAEISAGGARSWEDDEYRVDLDCDRLQGNMYQGSQREWTHNFTVVGNSVRIVDLCSFSRRTYAHLLSPRFAAAMDAAIVALGETKYIRMEHREVASHSLGFLLYCNVLTASEELFAKLRQHDLATTRSWIRRDDRHLLQELVGRCKELCKEMSALTISATSSSKGELAQTNLATKSSGAETIVAIMKQLNLNVFDSKELANDRLCAPLVTDEGLQPTLLEAFAYCGAASVLHHRGIVDGFEISVLGSKPPSNFEQDFENCEPFQFGDCEVPAKLIWPLVKYRQVTSAPDIETETNSVT